eukprot:352242-Chlamydomonas_euryale.AAC.2
MPHTHSDLLSSGPIGSGLPCRQPDDPKPDAADRRVSSSDCRQLDDVTIPPPPPPPPTLAPPPLTANDADDDTTERLRRSPRTGRCSCRSTNARLIILTAYICPSIVLRHSFTLPNEPCDDVVLCGWGQSGSRLRGLQRAG